MTILSIGLSGQQIAKANLEKFAAWAAERDAAGDWLDYVRGGKLNRSEIAVECGFALSVLRQNPAVKAALAALENRLHSQGILVGEASTVTNEADEDSARAAEKRVMSAKALADARVKALEEQNATLRAEVRELKTQLARFQHLDDHLSRTGRLLPP